ncbi:hypothetical protein [Haloarcula sp. H-GB5]
MLTSKLGQHIINVDRYVIGYSLSNRSQVALALVGGSLAMIIIMRRIIRANTLSKFGLWNYWMMIGMVLLNGIPIYLFLKYVLVLPLLATILMIGLMLWKDYAAVVDSPAPLFFGWWFVPLAVALVLGIVEYLARGIIT